MIVILFLLIVFFLIVFVNRSKFGKRPGGLRLEKIKKSPHYKKGQFRNLHPTPNLTEGVSFFSVIKTFFFEKKVRHKPIGMIPSIKTDLLHLDPDREVLVWFGHSSYFMQLAGKKILVDPVFSGVASPIGATTRAFLGTDVYTANDMPVIDYLFISHDHWDHLDYETIMRLKPKIKKVLCGLGTGAHFEYWGFDPEQLIELDWNDKIMLDVFTVHAVPARHFSGRGIFRNRSLWTSFVLLTPTMKIFIGGDSGYDTHFAKVREDFGTFDLVILENGQYDQSWKYIHMMPEEVIQAAQDMGAKRLFPVHVAKFALANHSWDAPLERIRVLSSDTNILLLTPKIGALVDLNDVTQTFEPWWIGVE